MTEDYYQTIRKQFSGPFFFIMVAVKMHCFGYALGDHWWLPRVFLTMACTLKANIPRIKP